MVGTAAMVIILSAFAGLDTMVRNIYVSFDPDIQISPSTGKYAAWGNREDSILQTFTEIEDISSVIEDKALFRYREREYIATVKGVDENYYRITEIDSAMDQGQFVQFDDSEVQRGAFGAGVAYYLGVSSVKTPKGVSVYVPIAGNVDRFNPMGNVRFRMIYPEGIFQVQPEFDSKYVFTTIDFARSLFGVDTLISAKEIRLNEGTNTGRIKEEMASALGEEWLVRDRDDLQVAIFKVLKSEGLITYLVLTFILLVASFGILSSVNILILEKKKDLHTLWSMGATEKLLRKIFLLEGLLVSLGGAGIGFILGIIVVLLQQNFGLVSMGQGYIVEYYPVEIRPGDMIQVLLTILVMGYGISWLAVRRLKISGAN